MRSVRRFLPVLAIAVLALAVAAAASASTPLPMWVPALAASRQATSYPPIDPGPATVLPDFVGSAVGARPLPSANVPQDPCLGRNPYGYIHDDSWNLSLIHI